MPLAQLAKAHRTVDAAITGLFVPGALPVEAELGGVSSPDLEQLSANEGRVFLA